MVEIMTPDEFRSIGELLWGGKWKTKMAEFLQVDRTSIWRYANGDAKISVILSIALRSWEEKFQRTGEVPKG
jgi:hypothetical protein